MKRTILVALMLCLALFAAALAEETPAPDAVPYGRIREYFNRAQNAETDFETGQPAYKGKIVFAVSDGNLHTSLSEEPKYDFSRIPQGRLAASFDEADTLVLIYADYKVVGQYTPMVRARKTYTKVCVADLRQDVLYKPFDAVVTDPPRSVTIRTMNGIPTTGAFSGDFEPQQAIDKVAGVLLPAEPETEGSQKAAAEKTGEAAQEKQTKPFEKPQMQPLR